MAEATDSVHLAKLRARMGMAVMVLARLKAIKAANSNSMRKVSSPNTCPCRRLRRQAKPTRRKQNARKPPYSE